MRAGIFDPRFLIRAGRPDCALPIQFDSVWYNYIHLRTEDCESSSEWGVGTPFLVVFSSSL